MWLHVFGPGVVYLFLQMSVKLQSPGGPGVRDLSVEGQSVAEKGVVAVSLKQLLCLLLLLLWQLLTPLAKQKWVWVQLPHHFPFFFHICILLWHWFLVSKVSHQIDCGQETEFVLSFIHQRIFQLMVEECSSLKCKYSMLLFHLQISYGLSNRLICHFTLSYVIILTDVLPGKDGMNMCLNSMEMLKKLITTGYCQEKLGMVLRRSTRYVQMLHFKMHYPIFKEMIWILWGYF